MWRRATNSSFFLPLRQLPKHHASLSHSFTPRFSIHTRFQEKGGISPKQVPPVVAFVLGGPGSGKGTQCAKIVETFGYKHLSAGDLLRREIISDSEYGSMILSTISEGKIVPSEITVKLILREMESSDNQKFLIDGFPRSEENRIAFEKIIGAEPHFVLFFDCPEEEMVKRVLSRNQIKAVGTVDEIFEQVRPVFEACEYKAK